MTFLKRLLLVPATLAVLAGPSQAGIFGRKTAAPPPQAAAQYVAQLLQVIKTNPDERMRLSAATELARFDARTSAEFVPVLLDVLKRDASADVRSEAATTLGKLRPVSQQIGYSLEQALNGDVSTKVRMSARTALWQYKLGGYNAPGQNPQAMTVQTVEPPLADAPPVNPLPTPTAPVPPQQPLVPPPAAQQPPPQPGFGQGRIFNKLTGKQPTPPAQPPAPQMQQPRPPVQQPPPRTIAPPVQSPEPPLVRVPTTPVPPVLVTPLPTVSQPVAAPIITIPAAPAAPTKPSVEPQGPSLGPPQ